MNLKTTNELSIADRKLAIRQPLLRFCPSRDDAQNLITNLVEFLKDKKGTWASYQALSNEVSLASVHQQCPHIQWAFPRISGDILQFLIPGEAGFEAGPLGTQHPIGNESTVVERDQLDGLLIPALAYDLGGVRLGRGKGYYDRTLKNYKKQTVGIALHDQVYAELPHEDFDLRVEWLVTDRGVLHLMRK